MSTKSLLIVGAGGHAKVVIDALRCALGDNVLLQLSDDNLVLDGAIIMGLPVITPVARVVIANADFHVAIGHNGFRARLAKYCRQASMFYQSVTHPKAVISSASYIADGCFIAANAVIAPSVMINEGCIINHGAVIDHDCVIGQYTHVAPNATLAGDVKVGEHVLIGAGANILPGVSIGNNCVVGAGAVVLRNLPAHTVYAGVPAQRIQTR